MRVASGKMSTVSGRWAVALMLAAVLTAGGADSGSLSGTTGFENYSLGFCPVEGAEIDTHDAGFVYTAFCGVPDAFVGEANNRYLCFKNVEDRIWRPVFTDGTSAGDWRIGPAFSLAETALYTDTMVQFVVSEGDLWDPITTASAGDKIVIWLQEFFSPNSDYVSTNLCVAAMQYDDDGWDTIVSTNVFVITNSINVGTGEWHRLTVRTMDDITREHAKNPRWYPDSIQGFMIWLDGQALASDYSSFTDGYVDLLAYEPDPHWGWLTFGVPDDDLIADRMRSGTIFASLAGASRTNALSAVSFSGIGAVDNVAFTTTDPLNFVNAFDFAYTSAEVSEALADVPLADLRGWADAMGRTREEVAADARARSSYMLGIDLGLAEDPRLEITELKEVEEGVWDITVRVRVRTDGQSVSEPIELHDGTKALINGTLMVYKSATLDGLSAAEPEVWPLVFEDDCTELTTRVQVGAGRFFRAALR